MRWRYHHLHARLSERPHRAAFARFAEALDAPRGTLYMFFTGRLLHFVRKNLEFLPPHSSVVLVGAALSDAECEWIRSEIRRPFHHVATYVDDRVIWEWLFQTARADFGWLDVDCFVQNPALLTDLFAFEPDAAVNCVWSYRTHAARRILCTHLLAVNHSVLARLRADGPNVSPTVHSFELQRRSGYRHGYTRRPSRAEIGLIRPLLPAAASGLPAYPSFIPEKGYLPYFDTMTLYQLCAEARGYRLHAVRDLQGTNSLERHFSNEVVHINAASYYRSFKASQNPDLRLYFRMLLVFDYLLLRSQVHALPPEYATRLATMAAELEELDLMRGDLAAGVRAAFRARGLDDAVFAHPAWRFLDGPAGA